MLNFWTRSIIRRCLSSPVFGTPGGSVDRKSLPSHGPLQLHNGWSSESDVENSLVYATHKKWFYLVTNIVFEKNGYSPYKDSDSSSHVDRSGRQMTVRFCKIANEIPLIVQKLGNPSTCSGAPLLVLCQSPLLSM